MAETLLSNFTKIFKGKKMNLNSAEKFLIWSWNARNQVFQFSLVKKRSVEGMNAEWKLNFMWKDKSGMLCYEASL